MITRGEVDLILNIDNHDFVVHNLYQGCFMGGYKIFKDAFHAHTARAVNSVTLHELSKDSIFFLEKKFQDFSKAIEIAKVYMRITKDPIVGFGLFRDPNGNITPIKL